MTYKASLRVLADFSQGRESAPTTTPKKVHENADGCKVEDGRADSRREAIRVLNGGEYTLIEAQEELGGSVDLLGLLESSLLVHKNMGLLEGLIEKNMVASEEEYYSVLQQLKIDGNQITELKKMLKAGNKWQAVFNPGHLTLKELGEVLFSKNIPYSGIFFLPDLERLRRIEIEDMMKRDLHKGLPPQLCMETAYKVSKSLPTNKAGISFVQEGLDEFEETQASDPGSALIYWGVKADEALTSLAQEKGLAQMPTDERRKLMSESFKNFSGSNSIVKFLPKGFLVCNDAIYSNGNYFAIRYFHGTLCLTSRPTKQYPFSPIND